MLASFTMTGVWLCCCVASSDAATDTSKTECWDQLQQQASEIDFEAMESFRAIHYLLAIAESCHQIKEQELAGKFYERAEKIAEADEKRRFASSLLLYAINIDNMELAEKIAKASGTDSNLDRLDLERFRRGDREAIKNYPRAKMTFYNAMELANVYVELGEYEKAEEFVTDIKISEENDPRDVTGMILEEIAKRHRQKDDMKAARHYIDKAVAIGGKLYYTGYAINITHRSIHGKLTEDLDSFAQRGSNYGGHMGRELVQLLVHELIRTGHFKEAIHTTRLLEKPEDVHSCMRALAIEQAARGDITAALKTVDELDDPLARNRARLGIAEVLAKAGNVSTAKKLADFVRQGLSKELDKEGERHVQKLAGLYGALHSPADVELLVIQADTPQLKAACISNAIQGFAEAQTPDP